MYFSGTIFRPGNMPKMLTGALAPDKLELECKPGLTAASSSQSTGPGLVPPKL